MSRGPSRPARRPSTTLGGRENQMISLAMDLVEKRMIEGTASAQEVTHFLKLGSTREQIDQERLALENELTRAKVEQLESAQRVEELYSQALNAMRTYTGQDYEEPDYED